MLNSGFWRYPIIETAGYFSVVVLCLVVSMALFEVVTKYKNWEEIKKVMSLWLLQQVGKYSEFVISFVFPLLVIAH